MPSVEVTSASSHTTFTVEDFGLADYSAIWKYQTQLVESRFNGKIPNTLLVGEHSPIITLGRQSKPENYDKARYSVLNVERGGDVTYHGPGQVVIYPIMHLQDSQRDLHKLLRNLEEAIIRSLKDFQIEGVRLTGKTGVWVKDPASSSKTEDEANFLKIASIGVAVKRWVTYHGLSLNVNPDMSHYSQINPCGFPSSCMTSMQLLLGNPPSMAHVKSSLIKHLLTVLN
jgi:lipoate-protein ligase B